jgi:hypothetical protein
MLEVSIPSAALTDIGRNDAARLAVASEIASRLEMPPGDADARPRLVSRSSSSAKAIERSPVRLANQAYELGVAKRSDLN